MKFGAGVLLLVLALCLAAPLYAAHVSGTDPFRVDVLGVVTVEGRGTAILAEAADGLGSVPLGPGWRGAYLLGADSLGRDVAARLLYAGRTSLLLAGAATALCFALGGAAGVAAGALGGAADAVISGLLDLVWAFPVMLLAISLSLALAGVPGEGSLGVVVLVLGAAYAPYVARPVRAALREVQGAEFIEAARATGGGRLHVLRRHALPQLAPLLGALLPVVAAMMLLTEATLSVLGLGVQAPGASWGTMIADGQALLHQRPLVAIAPGAAVAVTVLALNAVAERFGAAA